MLLLFWIEPHMFTKSSSSTPVDLIESGNKNENQKEQRKETHGSESQTKDVYWAIRIVVSSMTIFGFLIFWSFSSYLLKHISVHRSRINENRFNLWLIYVCFFLLSLHLLTLFWCLSLFIWWTYYHIKTKSSYYEITLYTNTIFLNSMFKNSTDSVKESI